ncbi:MAG: hypothetical protein Q8Q95_00690 [bacterium]|nr:hypothetical protein [bacterium]
MKNKAIIVIICILLAGLVWYAVDSYKKSAGEAATGTTEVDLNPNPTSILPSDYSLGFVEWFVFGPNKLYGFSSDEVYEKIPEGQIRSIELAGESSEYNRVTLSSTLTTQDWYVKENQSARLLVSDGTKPIVLKLSDGNSKKSWTKDISSYQPFANILYVWSIMPDYRYKLEEYPLAFWLRYNIANADGFTQVFTLFKIEPDGTLREVKTFEGRNGFVYYDVKNGTFLVGESATEDPLNGFLGHEKTYIIKYSASTFKQISDQTIANVYWTDEWLKWND